MKRLIVALVASVAVSAAFAKIVDTQGFETDRSAFVSDGQEGEDESFLDTYGTRPGFAAPYNFTDLGETAALQYGDKFLSLDTGDATVWRTNEFEAAYFDMAMQFNPSTSAPTLEDGTKIAVYLNSSSNLVIMAGPKDGDLPTEYVTTNTLAPEAWARLTISAINDTQFQAHLNGVIVGTSAGQDTFASLTGETAVKSVGFKGTGALDDFVARSTDPFIVDPVAKIGEEGYATLAAAMGDATNGVTVVLQKESNENVELPEAGVVFNTNGQTYNGQVSAASGLGWTVDNGVYTADNNSASMWTNESGDNMWTTADNWSNHAVPGTTTVVTFNNDATVYTGTLNANCAGVTLNGNLTIARDAVLSSYTRLVIYGNGNITGSGKTLTLRRAGIWSVSTCVIDSNLEFYNATPVYATAGEDCFLENGVFTINGTVSGSGLFKLLTRSVTFNGAVTLDNGTISSINATTGGVPTFNAAVTLTNSSLITTYAVSYGGPVSLGDDARISIGSANQTYGENFSLSGSGRVIFDTQNAGAAMQTQLQKTDGTWTGVCELKNISFGSGSVNPNVYANSNSSLCFNGVTAGILTGPSGTTYGMDIELLGNGLTLNGTLSGNNDFVFSGALEGAGALTLSTTSGRSTLRFSGDTSGFTGNITATGSGRVAFGADQAGSAPLIYVHTGATVTVADGATWATGTVSVNGNLTVNGTIENTLAATINNGATATVASGATWTAGSGFGVVGTFDVHGTIARSGGNSIVLYGDNTTGEVKFYDASTALKTNSIASNWRATYVVGWSPSSAFNPNEYGYANSVVAFAEDFSSGGYFGTGVDEPFVIQPTVRIDASRIFIQGGFVKADDSSLVTFTQLAGSGKFCSYGTSSAGLYAYYRINTLKEFSGSFEINQHANCAIGNIVLESSPVAGTRVIPMKVSAFSAAINSPA